MVAIDFFLFGGLQLTQKPPEEPPVMEQNLGDEVAIAISPQPLDGRGDNAEQEPVSEPEGAAEIYLPFPEPVPNTTPPKDIPAETKPDKPAIDPLVDVEIQEPVLGPPAKVVVIIDDMGLNAAKTREVIELQHPLTLAFLPYADGLDEKTSLAKQKGHELMIHIPMEAMNPDLDGGPFPLTTGLERAEFEDVLDKVFASFEGYAGVNNHMGSRLTQDPQRMGWVMERLKGKQLEGEALYFVDSKTINTSIAAQTAAQHGIPHNTRDVFLDHYETEDDVMKALEQLERVARNRGYAIAIGHPKQRTVSALKKWLPTLDDKNLELVAMSDVVKRPVKTMPPQDDVQKTLDIPAAVSTNTKIIFE